MEARRELMRAARSEGGAEKALEEHAAAQRKYEEAVRKIDKDLDEAVRYSKKAPLRAALTALGVIGNAPAPPMAGMMGPGGRRPRP